MEFLHFREPVNAWTHGLWMLLCIPAGLWLVWRARVSALKLIGCAVFAVSLVLCFGGSALYHAVNLPPEGVQLCARLDFIGIFLLIAGTTTPVMLVVLEGSWRWGTLAVMWAMAAGGILLRMYDVPLPGEIYTAFYILMGWTTSTCLFQLRRRVPASELRWLWIGGLLYSLGAVLNELHWPNLAPGYFQAHELHHISCMAASLCHWAFMMRVGVTFQAPQLDPHRPIL